MGQGDGGVTRGCLVGKFRVFCRCLDCRGMCWLTWGGGVVGPRDVERDLDGTVDGRSVDGRSVDSILGGRFVGRSM